VFTTNLSEKWMEPLLSLVSEDLEGGRKKCQKQPRWPSMTTQKSKHDSDDIARKTMISKTRKAKKTMISKTRKTRRNRKGRKKKKAIRTPKEPTRNPRTAIRIFLLQTRPKTRVNQRKRFVWSRKGSKVDVLERWFLQVWFH
jgi:hypothetical protein